MICQTDSDLRLNNEAKQQSSETVSESALRSVTGWPD